jgi:hypothetical protein
MQWPRPDARPLLVATLLVAAASLRIAATYQVFSFTIDEPGHFACGLEYLAKHVYRYETQHPPLARAAMALAPYLVGIRPLGEENRNVEGRAVILRSRHPQTTLALMRLGTLPFFWLACAVVFLWCRRHFDHSVALAGVALFTLLPPVLAHAGLACTDMALAACLAAAFLALILWSESPDWKHGILFGLAAGLAALAKFTALLYFPCCAIAALLLHLAAVRPGPRKIAFFVRQRAPTFVLALCTGALLIWAAYWFSFGKVGGWNISLPAPELFDGLREARAHDQNGHPAYLLGRFSMHGWWYYFPIDLAVKTPIAFLALAGLGVCLCLRKCGASVGRLVLAFCLGILVPAMAGHVDIGVRLILPIYIGLSILAAIGFMRLARGHFWERASAVGLLLWMAFSGAAQHPDYISYFNAFAGRDPAKVLADSDLDWGQDLKRLGRRLNQLHVANISVLLLEPLAQPLPVEAELQRFYRLPRMQLENVVAPHPGWHVISPTMDKLLGLKFTPWYDKIPPTEAVGALRLYYVP